MAFRGSNEIIGSPNNGNYLGILELLAQYDPFLEKHMKKHGNKGSGHVNYLSSTICEDLIALMANDVLTEIITRIKSTKYFSISVDSTPDEGHIDQLTIVIRYMEDLIPVERFLTFIPNCGHTGHDIAQALLAFLQDKNLDVHNCRGQSYDNAANMSGKYQGMQALILKGNRFATYIPCCAHSLNLVGKAAANTCPAAVLFFNFIQELFVFFTSTPTRYKILTEKLSTEGKTKNYYTLKNLNDTRWSCRADATKALSHGYNHIQDALTMICDDIEQKDIVKCQARGLLQKMSTLEIAIYTQFWHDILERFNSVSTDLQRPAMTLNTAVNTLKSLKTFVEYKRNEFDVYEAAGKKLSGTEEYTSVRVRSINVRLQPLNYGKTSAVQLSSRDKFRIESFLQVLDQLTISLAERISAYETVCERFGFFADLETIEMHQLELKAQQLVETYPDDLETTLGNELVQLAALLKQYSSNRLEDESVEIFLYKIIFENNLRHTFVNSEIALRIYLSMMVSNCSGERSFSKMKIIKNRLRTSMEESRLVDLCRLSLESDILRQLSFHNILTTFGHTKLRRVSLK